MRTDTYSALDFMYWILESVEENYTSLGETAMYQASSDSSLMQTAIVEASLVCGVETPRTFSALMAKVDRYQSSMKPQDALRKRGAILHRGGSLHVSVGDEERMVGVDTSDYVSLYSLGINDRDPAMWDGAFKLPELRYM